MTRPAKEVSTLPDFLDAAAPLIVQFDGAHLENKEAVGRHRQSMVDTLSTGW
jgi:hypothetical protein